MREGMQLRRVQEHPPQHLPIWRKQTDMTQSTSSAKQCLKCGNKLRSDNRSGFCYRCRTYARLTPYGKQANCDRSRKNHAEFRAKISAIKVARGCADCGYNRYPEALDFDHMPGAGKTKSIALMWGWAWEKVLTEISKCEVVCSNCHRHRTKVRSDSARAAIADTNASVEVH